MNTELMFSSEITTYGTPQHLFDRWNAMFGFTLDVCAFPDTAKCINYFTPEINGLAQEWTGRCWMNPPYGRGHTERWVKKAYLETRKDNCIVMALLPSRKDTKWYHNYIEHKKGVFVINLPGRIKFDGAKDAAPFPSMLVLFTNL